MPATVFLVRHAKHSVVDRVLVGRMARVRLSDEGRREAQALADRFAGSPVSVVHSSPRRRACETAEPVAAALGLSVGIVAELDEIDFGDWTGCSFAELAPDPCWQAWNAARSTTRPPGGETMIAAQARVVGHLERLGRSLGGGQAILISHCEVIRAALLHILGKPVDAWCELDVAPASISTIEIGPGRPRVLAVNETVGLKERRAS